MEVVGLLLEASADKDKAHQNGATPLIIASHQGHLDVVRLLLEANADNDKANNNGKTPMFFALQQGHLEVLRLLLEAGADRDTAAGGATPMGMASHILTWIKPRTMAQLR